MSSSGIPAASLVIVRHGETDWNIGRRIQGRTDIPLNETGIAQAGEVAELLGRAGDWQRVVVSPLDRAATTGRIIAERLGLAGPETAEDIIERDFGSAEGELVRDAEAQWPGLDVPDAEPPGTLAERGAAAFERLLREAPGSVVVAHGALIRAALTTLSGEEAPRILNGEAWLLSAQEAPSATGTAAPATTPSTTPGRITVRRLGTPARQHAL